MQLRLAIRAALACNPLRVNAFRGKTNTTTPRNITITTSPAAPHWGRRAPEYCTATLACQPNWSVVLPERD
jgi:hypothetical protein